MILRLDKKTRSGFPGKFCLWSLYLNPILCTSLRTAISGFMFLDLMRAIFALRRSGEILSANGLPHKVPAIDPAAVLEAL